MWLIRGTTAFVFLLVLWASNWQAHATTIEQYGQLPTFRAVTISPDGKHLALLRQLQGEDSVIVIRRSDGKALLGVNVSKFKARRLTFATDKHLLVHGTATRRIYTRKTEHSGVLLVNLETKESDVLLKYSRQVHDYTSSVGSIVGIDSEAEVVYMPVYSKSRAKDLYQVKLKNGRGKIHARGSLHTIDWFVGEGGRVLAREDFNDTNHKYRLLSKVSGSWEEIYSCECEFPAISVRAVSKDESSLYVVQETDDQSSVHTISLLTGEISEPVASSYEVDVGGFYTSKNRKVRAIISRGFLPNYNFLDEQAAKRHAGLIAAFPEASVSYRAMTADERFSIVLVGGSEAPNVYYLFDTDKWQAKKVASQYPDVENVGEVTAIRYKARDGLSIPGVVTWPPGKRDAQGLPLIVFPHGGPESHSEIGFDWWAQYFASRGYLILQPNFRGSDGFGVNFRKAGHGKWGREMQTDVSDGVKALVTEGYADPHRVCIMGASYGGYSALAGGAFSPELYRCVVSVAGVSDLPRMLGQERYDHGSKSWVVAYWNKVMAGSTLSNRDLREVSPVRFADSFEAPVLLIHGKDDTVVPMTQSKVMARALRKAGKPYEFITLKGEDHWLSRSRTRLSMLKAIDEFLMIHNPPDEPTALSQTKPLLKAREGAK